MNDEKNARILSGFYYFEVKIAMEVGVKEAIVFNHIGYWVMRNGYRKSKKHFRDGRYWTYLSYHDLSESFPFWTERQLRTIIGSLVKSGFIIKGHYGRKLYYRANWYTVPEKYLNKAAFRKSELKRNKKLE
jgi:hypothetical protein